MVWRDRAGSSSVRAPLQREACGSFEELDSKPTRGDPICTYWDSFSH